MGGYQTAGNLTPAGIASPRPGHGDPFSVLDRPGAHVMKTRSTRASDWQRLNHAEPLSYSHNVDNGLSGLEDSEGRLVII